MNRFEYRCEDKLQPERMSFVDKHPGFVYLAVLAFQIVMVPVLVGQWALFAGPGVTFTSDLHGVLAWVGIIADFAIHPLVIYYFNTKGVFDD